MLKDLLSTEAVLVSDDEIDVLLPRTKEGAGPGRGRAVFPVFRAGPRNGQRCAMPVAQGRTIIFCADKSVLLVMYLLYKEILVVIEVCVRFLGSA